MDFQPQLASCSYRDASNWQASNRTSRIGRSSHCPALSKSLHKREEARLDMHCAQPCCARSSLDTTSTGKFVLLRLMMSDAEGL